MTSFWLVMFSVSLELEIWKKIRKVELVKVNEWKRDEDSVKQLKAEEQQKQTLSRG